MLTNDELRDLLRQKCKHRNGQAEFAKRHNIPRQTVNDAFNGKRPVGQKIRAALGYPVMRACKR